MIEVGMKGSFTVTVTESLTAKEMKSGDLPVFATPAMVAAMEAAAVDAVKNDLDEGNTTVGCGISISHSAPTVPGMAVTAEATLIKAEGRMLTFEVKASDGSGIIGKGEHTRVIVAKDKFMKKAMDRSV